MVASRCLYGSTPLERVGLRLFGGDELDAVATVRIDGGLGTGLYLVRNPHKLGRVGEAVELAR